MKKSIFLSHTHADKPFVRKLASDLEAHGIQSWLDEAEIRVGESLIEKIRQGLDHVDYVAAILSPNSIVSPWVQRELDVAMNQEISGRQVKVLPIMYHNCELPGFLLGKFYADFTDEKNYPAALKRLVESIGIVFNKSVLDSKRKGATLGEALDRAFVFNLPMLVRPFHRPFQYMGQDLRKKDFVTIRIVFTISLMKEPVTRLDYCQYLLVSQINYTLTHFADHCESFSHDAINRYLRGEKITPRLVWDNVRSQVVASEQGYVVFDDTVLDKTASMSIELVRRQYSGNAKAVIKGIGVVTCIYVNPEHDQFWLIDYRIYDPAGDGKSKLDHVQEMLSNVVYQKALAFQAVLMDTWYATKHLMLLIEALGKVYYCPLKANRQVDDSDGQRPYVRVDALPWQPPERSAGKRIKIKGFPKDHKVRLFRVEVSTHRTDWVVTNDATQDSAKATQQVCGFRWKIEQLHREGKQLTGLERCQCRKARIQRNHIGCALLVWVRLKAVATETGRTLYQVKHGLLDDYLIQQLKNPSVKMQLA